MNGCRRFTLIVFLLILCPLSRGQGSLPELVINEQDPHFGSIQWLPVHEINGEGHQPNAMKGPSLLRVYTRDPEFSGENDVLPAILGKYLWEDDRLIFQPRFPFLSGRTYWIWFVDRSGSGNTVEIKVPENHSLKPPSITALYPTSDQWPANQLKCYIYFDQPMLTGQVSQFVQLYDGDGKRVDAPFLEMGGELWDPEQKRLTIWFDPGRIKSLLIPNQRLGPPLQPNQTYRLVIRRDWRSVNDLPMEEDYVKSFKTGPKDTRKPDPEDWIFKLPAAGTLDPLQIRFPEAMDVALLFSGFGILTGQNEVLNGKIKIGNEEKSWYWYPEQPWEQASYFLRISTDVEDLAGNNLIRLFDSPVEAGNNPGQWAAYIDQKLLIR